MTWLLAMAIQEASNSFDDSRVFTCESKKYAHVLCFPANTHTLISNRSQHRRRTGSNSDKQKPQKEFLITAGTWILRPESVSALMEASSLGRHFHAVDSPPAASSFASVLQDGSHTQGPEWGELTYARPIESCNRNNKRQLRHGQARCSN